MIKKLIFCLGAVLSISVAQAQDFKVGVRAGLNSSSVFNANTKNTTTGSILAPHAGLIVNGQITKRHSVQAELLYSGKGFTTTKKVADQNNDIVKTYKMSYIDLPVIYQFYVLKSKHTAYYKRAQNKGLYLLAGPQFSALLSASTEGKVTTVTDGVAETKDSDINLTSYVRNFDVALVGGLGYRFSNSTAISARYAASLLPLCDVGNHLMPTTVHNGTFQVSLTYYFPPTF